MPHPNDLVQWYQRDRAIQQTQKLLAAYRQGTVPARRPHRTRLTQRELQRRRDLYGAQVRVEATRIAEQLGVDPEWQQHQQTLLEAVKCR